MNILKNKSVATIAAFAATILAVWLASQGCADPIATIPRQTNNSNWEAIPIENNESVHQELIDNPAPVEQPAYNAPVNDPYDSWIPVAEREGFYSLYDQDDNIIGQESLGWLKIFTENGQWGYPKTNHFVQLPSGERVHSATAPSTICNNTGYSPGSLPGNSNSSIFLHGPCREPQLETKIAEKPRTIPGANIGDR